MRRPPIVWILLALTASGAVLSIDPIYDGELAIDPPKQEWAMLSSTAYFKKPTVLIEHRDMPRLRGIVSTRRGALKNGQSIKFRLKETCENIRRSYAVTKTNLTVEARVIERKIPYCRVQVQEQDGHIDQLLFVSQETKKSQNVITQTITFFYPASDQARAAKEVTKFIASVRRGDG